jgi:hypothetical protein
MNDFLPKDYEVPVKSNNYMKLEDGDNRIRFLSSPILGYVWWINKDGVVRQEGEKPEKGDRPVRVKRDGVVPSEAAGVYKHFWAAVVYNYRDEQIQVLEVTQSSIQKLVDELSKSADWGDPREYDIVIKKTGEGLETRYPSVIPSPKKDLPKELKAAYEATNINLEKLYEGGDPFEEDRGMDENVDIDKIPF